MDSKLARLWQRTRHGSWAGRGFRYQDSVAAALAVELWSSARSEVAITPEGVEDISLRAGATTRHVQVKSRLSHRGEFKSSEVASWLATIWRRLLEAGEEPAETEVELVLERRVEGLSEEAFQIIEIEGEVGQALRSKLEVELGQTPPAALLSHSSVRVLADPESAVLPMLTSAMSLPQAACMAHFLALRDLMGRMADANGSREYEERLSVGFGDIQRLLDDVTEFVDASALDTALREGVAEAVDFLTSIDDPAFFEGIDVVPGHVVAGLPVDRPLDLGPLIDGLFSRRAALVKGPSGSGKSALIWLSAYATRHSVRWYRVRSLGDADVPTLVRMAKGARPTDRCPVGFVVDDLGHAWTAGWDQLTREARALPGVLLLGAVREEDALLLTSEAQCHVHRPALDENLARAIWEELSQRGETRAAGWREAYDESEGLLLEYCHLLRRGDTLRKTIQAQVARRTREKRLVEISILRLVSLADRWGAAIPARSIEARIAAPEEEFRLGLARLLEEHLVKQVENGLLGGLHRLRSVALCDAIHEVPVPALTETAVDVLETVEASCLARVVHGATRDRTLEPPVVVAVIAGRIEATGNPDILVAGVVGLRLASLHRQAATWAQTLDRLGVSESHRPLVGLMVIAGVEAPAGLNSEVSGAIAELSDVAAEDLRPLLLADLEEGAFDAALHQFTTAAQALELFGSLAGAKLEARALTALSGLAARRESSMSIREKAALLEAAYDITSDLAIRICPNFGGTEALLEELRQELIWPHDLRVEGDRVRGDLRYVAPSEVPDAHEAVVELCRLALACAPAASVAEIKAIFADGRPMGFGGHLVADKRIPRRNLPGNTSVLWRRRQYRLFYSAIARGTQTERLQREKELLERCAPLLHRVGSTWCRGKHLPNSAISECQAVVRDAETLGLPPIAGDVSTTDLDANASFSDPLSTLVSGLFSNAVVRLYGADPNWPSLAAFLFDTLLVDLDKVAEPGRWRLLETDPSRATSELRSGLTDLHAAVSEEAWGAGQRNAAIRKAARGKTTGALRFRARVARSDAEKRLVDRLRRVERTLSSTGIPVECLRRVPEKRSGLVWPSDEILIVHRAATVFEWAAVVEAILSARAAHLEDVRSVLAVPSRDGRIVADLGGTLQSRFFPLPDCLDDWLGSTKCQPLETVLAAIFSSAIDALSQASAIFTGICAEDLVEHERRLAQRSIREAERAIERVSGTVSSEANREPIELAVELLDSMRAEVKQQIELVENGSAVETSLATQLIPDGLDEASSCAQQVGLVKLLLLEWDVEPEGVMTRLAEAEARIAARTGAQL